MLWVFDKTLSTKRQSGEGPRVRSLTTFGLRGSAIDRTLATFCTNLHNILTSPKSVTKCNDIVDVVSNQTNIVKRESLISY